MIILPQDQINRMVPIIDHLYKCQGCRSDSQTVGGIKKAYNLTEAEYQMCMDLAMPTFRAGNGKDYWKFKYKSLKKEILRTMSPEMREKPNELIGIIEDIVTRESRSLKNHNEYEEGG